MTDCPSCGRYAGPYGTCPYCGAALSGRTSVRLLKITALTLALGGLALLWLLATRTAVPTVEIGQVNAMMNMAYVRVEGLVTRPPSYDADSGYLSFWLRDDTGELHVAVYRDESKALIDSDTKYSQIQVGAQGDEARRIGGWSEMRGRRQVFPMSGLIRGRFGPGLCCQTHSSPCLAGCLRPRRV